MLIWPIYYELKLVIFQNLFVFKFADRTAYYYMYYSIIIFYLKF